MRKQASLLITVSMIATAASASPGVITTSVNFRAGPGTGYASLGKLPEGISLDVGECDGGGTWCAVSYEGKQGFVSGKYISQADPQKPNWPRSFTTEKGETLTFFQPQIVDWPDFTHLDALIATEFKPTSDAKPQYGIIGVRGTTVADDTSDEVVLTDVTATQVDFSTLDRAELAGLALEVGKILPTGPITLSQERLTASLADYKRLGDVNGIKSDPPKIVVSNTPAILVQTDGKEVLSPVNGVDGLEFVVNTNWDLFKTADPESAYFLRDEKSWLTSKSLRGEWSEVTQVPEALNKLPDDESWKDSKASIPAQSFEDGKVPKVVYSEEPAELLLFDGEPRLETVKGTGLEWASNTTSDVFFRKSSNTWYVLLSGRWFSSPSLDGPWTFATPNLPADFQNIPDDAPYYQVRASVPGTSESAEARLKASIPQMARVSTDGTVKLEVAYSGEPKFEAIKGTTLAYAANSNDQVIKVGDAYFALKDGVWFTSASPTGPWAIARAVPDEIYKIPPSSPVYNVTYVRVYNTEPDAVWFGYTMGYLGAYLAWDTFVYGTGWLYPSYWDFGWAGGGYWPYYPRPLTYGVGAFYNPAYGTFGRYGYAYGPYRGVAGGAAYNPRTGTYIRGGAVAGPNGSRGFVAAYNPITGNAAVARGGHSVYGSWGTAGVKHGSDFARISGGSTGNAAGVNWRTSDGNHGFVAGGKGGDIYAGRDGNVYRKENGSWQKHTPAGWQPVNKPNAENLKQHGQNFADKHPDVANHVQQHRNDVPRQRPSQRSGQAGARAPDHLAIDRAGRQIGNQRELRQNFGRQNIGQFRGGDLGGRSFRGGGAGFQAHEFGGRFGGGFGGGGFHGGGGHFRRR
ncbi:SH3 domain-containing protein (plasmid) [Agrobacterium tumefaciens]|uniref:SH3 domain-containing protein n=1 Tax=Agrobacterium tumefaciens TaxID=358 RepID=UPI00157460B6|nr:SH3 domain-containing protein [Agrobacterium tumefaciens]NSZ66934.1 SH3 domain-containing protein [Agrobacterium tumefaciens]NTA73132.1 SH3 domain-containing protein [Agrobacterium tumefaciens]WIE41669.1 SH3 domain-containing protein [Agrobacterium tumefaciens]